MSVCVYSARDDGNRALDKWELRRGRETSEQREGVLSLRERKRERSEGEGELDQYNCQNTRESARGYKKDVRQCSITYSLKGGWTPRRKGREQ